MLLLDPLVKNVYKIYDWETKWFLNRRDIIFHDDSFPFLDLKHVNENETLVFPLLLPDQKVLHLTYKSLKVSLTQKYLLIQMTNPNNLI